MPTPWKVIGNSEGVWGGGGVSKANFFKGKYVAKQEFQEEWKGLKPRIPPVTEVLIFSGTTHYNNLE